MPFKEIVFTCQLKTYCAAGFKFSEDFALKALHFLKRVFTTPQRR